MFIFCKYLSDKNDNDYYSTMSIYYGKHLLYFMILSYFKYKLFKLF